MTGVMPPVNEALTPFVEGADWTWEQVTEALLDREDQIATYLLTAGMNLGGDPAFVAKAILDIGIGRPKSEEEERLINAAFAERVAYYQQQFGPPDERG